MAMMRRPPGFDERELLETAADAAHGRLLLTARQAASLCSRSLRTWRSWDAAGLIPRPVRVNRTVLWRSQELTDWIAAGCPRRAEWEARR